MVSPAKNFGKWNIVISKESNGFYRVDSCYGYESLKYFRELALNRYKYSIISEIYGFTDQEKDLLYGFVDEKIAGPNYLEAIIRRLNKGEKIDLNIEFFKLRFQL